MDLAELIISSKNYLSCFDYDHYPPCFEEFEASAAELFNGLSEATLDQEVEALLQELEQRRSALSRREQKKALFADRQVLSLFFTPAARRRGGSAAEFAERLCLRWKQRYPREQYYPGDFETILNGFDANLLGLPLRKSKQR